MLYMVARLRFLTYGVVCAIALSPRTLNVDLPVGAEKFASLAKAGLPALRGKHLAFIGDSVTRYQYLNMAYALSNDDVPPVEFFEKAFAAHAHRDGWLYWFQKTNQLLRTEHCDCYRKAFDDTLVENRFLELKDKNSSVSFFWKNEGTFKGHWHPKLHGYPIDLPCTAGKCRPPYTWQYGLSSENRSSFIREVLMQLRPKLTHIIFSTSLSPPCQRIEDLRHLFSVGRELSASTGTIFIWKTSTAKASQACTRTEVQLAKHYGWTVFDLNVVAGTLRAEESWDGGHFKEHVNSYFNYLLLQVLR